MRVVFEYEEVLGLGSICDADGNEMSFVLFIVVSC